MNLWCKDSTKATAEYGRIEEWNTSEVTDMNNIFIKDQGHFNDDISAWDMSRVIDMHSMFKDATAFNQDLSGWDVSTVMNINSMFRNATSFDQDLSR